MEVWGQDPLDGVSIYDGGDFWHFVTFGFSELHEKESEYKDISGFGYEMTFKLKKGNYKTVDGEFGNVVQILQMLARAVFVGHEAFSSFEFIGFEDGQGIDAEHVSELTGFITINDPSVNTLYTKNGKVEFLELIGVTDKELHTLSDLQSVKDLYAKLGTDVTDYGRKSIV